MLGKKLIGGRQIYEKQSAFPTYVYIRRVTSQFSKKKKEEVPTTPSSPSRLLTIRTLYTHATIVVTTAARVFVIHVIDFYSIVLHDGRVFFFFHTYAIL